MTTTDTMRRRRWLVPAAAAAAAALLAPTAAHAADRIAAVIGDPYNSSALARVSEDGRLGTRGETTTQTGVPSNAWDAQVYLEHPDPRVVPEQFVHGARAGWGIGISQMTFDVRLRSGTASNLRGAVVLWLHRADGALCPERLPDISLIETLYTAYLPSLAEYDGRPVQLVFPVPLTVPASPTGSTCLYATVAGHHVAMHVSGVTGPATPAFVPAKGEDRADPTAEPTPTLK